MKKIVIMGAILLLSFGFFSKGVAGIRIGINIPLPPPIVFSAPPELAVVPGTYVYYCPDAGFDIFFYGGDWYRLYGGYWYLSANYGGPWFYTGRVPSALLSLPSDYRVVARGERRIPFAELHRNWRAWEMARYWRHHNRGISVQKTHSHFGLAPSFGEREYSGHAGRVYGGDGFSGHDREAGQHARH